MLDPQRAEPEPPPTSADSRAEASRLADTGVADVERLRQELDGVRAHLARTDRLITLGTLAAMIAHEFNNILTPIVSYSQLALARPGDHDLLRKAAEKSVTSGLRASRLANSVLGFAHGDPDQGETCRPTQAVHDALRCMAREPEKDGVEVRIDLPEVTLAIPPIHLQHVFLNLLINSVRAMRQTGGIIRIDGSTVPLDDPQTILIPLDKTISNGDAMFSITVHDNGPGIPPSIADRLFEPFTTLSRDDRVQSPGPSSADLARPSDAPENARAQPREAGDAAEPGAGSEPHSGSGLGLAVCRDLVTRSGGSIELVPSERGACFAIRVPLASA